MALRCQSRWPAISDIIDFLRPELRKEARLRFYSTIIEKLAAGRIPGEATLLELDNWTSPARIALRVTNHDGCYVDQQEHATGMELYTSKEDEGFCASIARVGLGGRHPRALRQVATDV